MTSPARSDALLTSRWSRRAVIAVEVALVVVALAIELGGTAGAARHQGRGDLGAAGIALLVVGIAAMPWRRRFPALALVVAFVTTLLYWSLGYPRGPVFVALIVTFGYAVLIGRRRLAITSIVLGFLLFPWLGYLLGREKVPGPGAFIGLAAWLIVLISVMEVIRSRRERAREMERSREQALARAAADERVRIAQELHDVVAHTMSVINVQAGVALHLMDDDPHQARDALATIKDVSKEGLVELRSILGALRAVDEGAPRSPTPTLRRLPDLVARAEATGVDVQVEIDGDVDTLPVNVDVAAYRIIQESLTNVARHSDRPEAVVRIHRDGDALGVEIVDAGSRTTVAPGGSGIAGMRERAASVGGDLDAGPRLGGGFAVRARLPVTAGS